MKRTTCQRLDNAAHQLATLDRPLATSEQPVPTLTWLAARSVCASAHETLREHGWRVPIRNNVDGLACAVNAARRFHDDDGAQWS